MDAIVLYPTPAIGHLVSMVELGKLILTSNPNLSIHILITKPPYSDGDSASYIAAVSSSVTAVKFHRLPAVTLPHDITSSSQHHETLTFEVLRQNKPFVSQTLSSLTQTHKVNAFVVDHFCGSSISIAAELNIASYIFYSSGASTLSSFLYLPILHHSTDKSLRELGKEFLLNFPGVPPIPATDMPKPILDREDFCYKSFLESSFFLQKANGVIVNTFEALEPRVIKAITEGLCVPDGPTPKLHCIGPLIHGKKGGSKAKEECLRWLDSQPRKSVVFLCFGSLGLFSEKQIKEIALGLEKSEQRFLWVVRNPPEENIHNLAVSGPVSDPNLEELMPEGFLERTRERGLVVKNWAPQLEVLSHDSVGGFVTHCGWNSVLESVTSGVPMVAWPLYAEQRFNRIVLVEEIKIALPMHEDELGFVAASEVERRVTELMASSEGGDSVRERVLRLKNEAEAALSDGGSSRVALTELTESWKKRSVNG